MTKEHPSFLITKHTVPYKQPNNQPLEQIKSHLRFNEKN